MSPSVLTAPRIPRLGSIREIRWAWRPVVTVVVASVTLVGTWARVGAAATVAPESYLQTVCGRVASVASDAESLATAVQDAAQAFQNEPTQANAVALRDALIALLSTGAKDIDDIGSAAQGAGTPKVAHGAEFAKALRAQLIDAAKEFHKLEAQARAIDVTSAVNFAKDVQAVGKKIDAVQKSSIKAAKHEPAFKHAGSALHPLVVFLTTDATTCAAPYGSAGAPTTTVPSTTATVAPTTTTTRPSSVTDCPLIPASRCITS